MSYEKSLYIVQEIEPFKYRYPRNIGNLWQIVWSELYMYYEQLKTSPDKPRIHPCDPGSYEHFEDPHHCAV